MSANGIAHLATRELRQKAKLDQAAIDRAADGNPRATYDITQLPTQYDDNAVVDNPNNGGGGTITNITISTPLTRSDGTNYLNPENVTVLFATPAAGGGLGTDKATGTPNIVAGKLAGINIVYGGTGYAKQTNVPIGSQLYGQVLCDIFIIDSTPGSSDTREIRDVTTTGVDVTASDIVAGGLLPGRPWA